MRLKIECASMAGADAKVWIDGELATDVIGLTIDMRADSFNQVMINRVLTDVDLDIEADDPPDTT